MENKTTSITPENEKLSTLPKEHNWRDDQLNEECKCIDCGKIINMHDWKSIVKKDCHTEPQEVGEKFVGISASEKEFELHKEINEMMMKKEEVADWAKEFDNLQLYFIGMIRRQSKNGIIPKGKRDAINKDFENIKSFITKTLEQERAKWRNELINLIKISETNNEFLDNLDKLLTKLKSN